VAEGRSTREESLRRYGAFSNAHARKYRCLLAAQQAVGRMTPSRSVTAMVRAVENRRLAHWIFDHYMAIAPPSFVDVSAGGASSRTRRLTTAAA
jgi:hypothetical protein